MKRYLLFIICYLLFAGNLLAQENLTDYVNPFIGTGGHGHTYPGAVLPFGMVQLSPDTRLDGWDGCSGYHYSDSAIYGFSHTHLSGTGCSDFGDILFMPTVGDFSFYNGKGPEKEIFSPFSKKNEIAKPGYYKVKLDNGGIIAELTATERAGMHRYIFPKSDRQNIIIDLEHRDEVIESSIKIINDHEIEGMRRSKAWAKDQYVYFVAQFSKPFTNHIIHTKDKGDYNGITELNWKNIKTALLFNNADTIVVRVGISAVSCDGARRNLETEIKSFDFDYYHNQATKAWNKELSKIIVKSKDRDKMIVFYSSLYHTMLAPNIYSDVDGSYRGMDLKIHHAEDGLIYNVFSLWDTYRAAHPLYTIIEPTRTNDFIYTFLKCNEESGRLPVWELAANETDCMIGYHSVSVIYDAYQKGIRGYDANKALEAMLKTSNENHFGLKAYKELGYIPSDSAGESVSRTLEYAYDDWCIAQMAQQLKKDSLYKIYIHRAQYWKNIFDNKNNFFRAKKNGSFKEPFDPFEVNFDLTEANTWQYNFYVPQDITGLMKVMGGKEKFVTKLDEMFTAQAKTTGREQPDISGMIGQYAHGNEPSHHMAYLYNYAGQPWKAQERVHEILTTLYRNDPDGLCGNEDCGQMSAWYVLSAMGFYPVCPGSGDYAIGTPLFDTVIINKEKGKPFVIIAPKKSEKDYYIQSATYQNKEYQKNYITQKMIDQGGTVSFVMGEDPWNKWGSSDSILIKTSIDSDLIAPEPYIKYVSKTFTDTMTLAIDDIEPYELFYYLINKPGQHAPQKIKIYKHPIAITESSDVEIHSVKGNLCKTVYAKYIKIPKGRTIKLQSKYSPQYAAGGDNALIDHIRGGKDFHTGEWQGYEGQDFDAIVDLGEVKDIHKLGLGCLQDIGSWIWYPTQVVFEISEDGINYTVASTTENRVSVKDDKPQIKDFTEDYDVMDYTNTFHINNFPKARYLKVHAKSMGTIPEWHEGKGGKSWLFIDEIIIE